MNRHLEPTERALRLNDEFVEARDRLTSGFVTSTVPDGREMAGSLTALTDRWIRALWDESTGGELDASIVALGGYGREELCLGSDVDLVIEVEETAAADPDLLDVVSRFMTWARLTRVKVAHAVRTPAQTENAFTEDIRTAISYLDARPIYGERRTTENAAIEYLRGDDEGRSFVGTLFDGYRARLRRFGQTIYLLEPDVKSGKGALRDLHMIRWAGLVRGGFDAEVDANEELGWTSRDSVSFRDAHEWLLQVRGLLHVFRGRKQDRLHFPDQERLAALLIPNAESEANATERLMRRHYKITRIIAKLAERAMRRWGPLQESIDGEVDDVFRVGAGQVHVDRDTDLEPEGVFEALRLASEYDVLLDPIVEERIEASVNKHRAAFERDPGCAEVTCSLLTDLETSSRTSARLLELGILTAVVPEFEPVVCHVQHDVYHVYTTDIHLLHCLEFARELLNGAAPGTDRWPAFAAVAADIEDQTVFLLATLFHDIGKNRGGGHSEKGARMMYDVGPRLGLEPAQTDLLAFLVREHLALSHTARRHDIADPRIIRDLAGRIRTTEALNQLTALTFCDMSNVGKNVMNDWNATLLLQLHARIRAAIEHGVEDAWRQIEQEVGEVREWLLAELPAGERGRIDAFVRDLPANYMVESPREALLRTFQVWSKASGDEIEILVTPDPERGSTEVIVGAGDIPGALAQITGTISSVGLNILDARIVTTSSGRLLDVFQVAQSGGASNALTEVEQRAVTDERRLDRLTERLSEVLSGEASVEDLLRKRIAETRLAPRPTPKVETVVQELSDVSDDYTVIQVKAPDRVGLLYEIARTLSDCSVDIRLSKIDSLGTQVIDTFYVESLGGEKLPDERVAEVIAALELTVRDSALHD